MIVGFGLPNAKPKLIYEYDDIKGEPHATQASQINAYLVNAPWVILENRKTAIGKVPPMLFGSMPNDGGHLLLTDEEKQTLLADEPDAAPWVKPFLGAEEFINRRSRWCLWLVNCPPSVMRSLPQVMQRVQAVRKLREASTRSNTRELADTPALFGEIRQPTSGEYLLVPRVSSEKRKYVPVGFLDASVIASDATLIVPNASLFHFGVLTSTMHNAWMRMTCGRLESRYRYSASIVYNNFPWPDTTAKAVSDKHRQAIEDCAQAVLDARQEDPHASLADLYADSMPAALVKAHRRLDAAVDKAYEHIGGKKEWKNDAERVAFLFALYEQATHLFAAVKATKQKRTTKES
ncbi:MAG: hypothetical protein RLZ36_489 [Pseudomonadota bacterium]